jgi:uncharacterized MAPEG superfamily protein
MLLYGVAIAAALVYVPYGVVAYARLASGFDFHAPRAMFDRLPNYAKRATWAHQNSFEVFMLFGAAALMVFVSGAASPTTTGYVLLFLVSRLGFSLFYILDVPFLRSPFWVLSMACVAGLMSASLGSVSVG